MSKKITIVDYGIGNLLSVGRALEKCGAEVIMTDSPAGILAADRLVLPGVGAFFKGMQGLRERQMIEPLIEYGRSGKPVLGICLGMQMLFSRSSEFGEHQGLGLIEGRVVAIEPRDESGAPMKVPHIGWSPLLRPPACATWDETVLASLRADAHAYFVHSYTAEPACEEDRLADVFYGSARISAAVQKGNIFGCQFHPEKSATVGLQIMKNFINMQPALPVKSTG